MHRIAQTICGMTHHIQYMQNSDLWPCSPFGLDRPLQQER
jgi:hypothetical protein